MRYLALILALFFSSFISFSQDYSVRFLDISDGLSNNSITTIYQDKDGYMWFGTYDGLNRYDGYTFKIFRNEINNENSLSNNTIYTLEEDSKRNIWIGGNKGASVYDKSKALFYPVQHIEKDAPATVLKSIVHQIKAVTPGLVLLATQSSGLVAFEEGSFIGKTIPITRFKNQLNYDALTIQKDKKGISSWIYIRNVGVCNYNYKSKKLQVMSPLLMDVKCMEIDFNGNLWIGTDEGVFLFNTSTLSISNNYFSYKCTVTNILRDKKNRFWFATDGCGIYTLDQNNEKVIPYTKDNSQQLIKSSAVWSIYEDHSGNIWFGTLRGGISMLSATPKYFKTIKYKGKDNNLAQNFILSACEDKKQNLWIGTDGAGLRYWNKKNNNYTIYNNSNPGAANYITSNFITNVICDSNNKIWLSTWAGGVNKIDPETNLITHYSCYNPFTRQIEKNIWLVYEDSQKNIWASATNEGCLYLFNPHKKAFELYDKTINNLQCLTETSDGKLWGGNYSAVVWINKTNKKHGEIVVGNPVRCVYEDKNKQLWVATQEGGLLLFNRKTNTFKRFTTADGLASNTILKILEDKNGNLWMSTYNGLSRLDTKTKIFQNFSKNDGLQSNQFSFNAGLKLSSGEFLFGGINGFNLFYPEAVKVTVSKAKILLSDLSVNNEPIATKPELISIWDKKNQIKEIILPYDQTTLSIEFVALDYSNADKINYAYFLEGWDDQWSNAGQTRKANYPHLSEGTYLFKVKTSDFQDKLNNVQALIRIVVLPPWYRSWWAYLLYVLVGITIIYNYIRYNKYKERLKYKVKIAEFEREKEKEIAEKQKSMFTYISHEFRTPLSLIINPLKKVIKKEEASNNASKGDLQIAYRNAKRLLSLVDQLLLFRKAENDADELKLSHINMNNLCEEVYQCFITQAKDKNINYNLQIPEHAISIIGDYEKIEISLFNLVSNAFKYTNEEGSIGIKLTDNEKEVYVSITDTGLGIAPNNKEAIFEKFKQLDSTVSVSTGFGIGLFIVKYFVDKHKGTVSCKSEIGKGSSFTLQFLKGQGHFADLPINPNVPKMSELVEELLMENFDESKEPATLINDIELQDFSREMLTDKKSILIIDDNAEIRNYLIQLFSGTHLVYSAINGNEGLKLTKEYMPDIVISDIAMEIMDGLELCKKIKESEQLSHIPVILLTASSNPETHLQGITDGADDYITKPFDDDLLIARVNTLLKSRKNLRKYFLDSITLKENKQKVPAEYQEFLKRCIDIIEANMGNRNFTIKNFAAEIGMSHRSLYTKIKIVSGETLNAFIRSIRLRRAALLLLTENMNIAQASAEVGFEDQKYFRQQFVKLYGMTPSAYIKKYKDSFNKELNIIK